MLIQLTKDNVKIIEPLVAESIKRSKIEKRTTPTYCLSQATLGIMSDTYALWVDDLENPTCFIGVALIRMLTIDEPSAIITNIFVNDEKDPNRTAKINDMITTAETYARHKGAKVLYCSSWVHDGAKSIQPLWVSKGFETQEILNVKKL